MSNKLKVAHRNTGSHSQPLSAKKSAEAHAAPEAKLASEAKKSGAPAKKDDYGKLTAETVASTTPKADTVMPALNRAFFTVAKQMEVEDLAGPLAKKAMAEFSKSPEAMALFKQVMPYVESNAVKLGTKVGAPVIGKVATSTLPLLANGQTVKALLKASSEVAGPNGRRLMGAVLRGLHKGGGMTGASAELAATAAKIAAKAPALGAAAGGVAKALPVIGNAVNIIAVGASLKTMWEFIRDPTKTKADILSQCLHLGATVTGCFIPPAGLIAAGIDVKRAVAPTTT